MKEPPRLRIVRAALPVLVGLWLWPVPVSCQDTGDQGTLSRGDRAEIAITVRDSSGQVITTPATVQLEKDGIPHDRSSTSRGRAFFIPRGLGEFTIVVEATGYKSTRKDISATIPGKLEVDVYMQRELAGNETTGVPAKPILAPKAQEALTKGAQALREGKLDEAEKYINKAVKLAPGNSDVLYVQGMLYMKQRNWEAAQSVLEKSDQMAPNQPRVLAALGMTLCNQGKYEPAIPLLEKSLQLDPSSGWETDWALAKAYYYHQQYEQALKMTELARANAHSAIPQVQLLLAQCLSAVGRYEDAAEVLRDFLKTNSNTPDEATARRWLDGLVANGKIHQ
jgi:Tfp pilus assembly protein PilF